MSLTFLPTGGPLAPDTYTVTLRSAANGLRDTAGGLLDGDGDGTPGGNFTATFTVAASTTRTVSVPDFARGPGQPVDLPATTPGLPIRLSDGNGVTSARLVLAYDPRLLTITAAAVGSTLPAGASVALDVSAPGQAVLTLTSPTALAAGPVDLVRLTAARAAVGPVRGRAGAATDRGDAQRRCDRGHGDAGLEVVAYFGDTTGNGAVQRRRRQPRLADRGGSRQRPGGLPAVRPGGRGRHHRQRGAERRRRDADPPVRGGPAPAGDPAAAGGRPGRGLDAGCNGPRRCRDGRTVTVPGPGPGREGVLKPGGRFPPDDERRPGPAVAVVPTANDRITDVAVPATW